MLKYVCIENLFGADPWEESINLAKDAGFTKNFKLTDEVPEHLPFQENHFDIIWAFSVFTHLAPQVAFRSLETLTKYLKPNGNLVITLRPIEYWNLRTDLPVEKIEKFKLDHNTFGDAFLAHDRTPSEKHGVTYGDTSISLKKLESSIGNLKVKNISGSEFDPYQIYVTLGL
jgi:2-polyprenyl-3-methyl-5-hydroxy-6-metoxy-1,4-benzoquinol methylase